MTTTPAPVAPTPVADSPQTGDGIAPDLTTLMERLERVRKYLRVEREYIKLVLIGGWFILMGAILTPGFPWRLIFMLALATTPFLLGWYNLPLLRLANAFRNETLPFLLRDYGRWNYALNGAHFSRDLLKRTGLVNPSDVVTASSIMTGERFGVPLQIAVVSAWPKPKFRIYRGTKANFEGWAVNIRLPDLPLTPCVILPNGHKPPAALCAGWTAQPLTPHHQLFAPPPATGEPATALPAPLLARLLHVMLERPQARYALLDGILWILVPEDKPVFHEARSFADPLYEPAPYERTRGTLAHMFKLLDAIVWPAS